MSSILKRVFQRFVKPTYLVGRDLEGNKYYEYPNTSDGRSRRAIQYKKSDDVWTYVAGEKKLPVQWQAWLTHTRPEPPGIEELKADLARQGRVRMNAAILEVRDKEEREGMAPLAQAQTSKSHCQVAGPCLENEPEQKRNEPLVGAHTNNTPTPIRDPWTEAQKGSDEPESWSPVVRRR